MRYWNYEIWLDGNCIRESSYDYESQDEAHTEAERTITDMLETEEGYEENTMEDFYIEEDYSDED